MTRPWRMRARVTGALVALMVATGLLVRAAPITAAGAGTMVWTTSGGVSFWKDPNCGNGNEPFHVRLFRDANYGGTQWRFCSDRADMCTAPFGADSAAAQLCYIGVDGDTVNDYPSSMKVIAVNGGASCRVLLKEHKNFGGAGLVEWDPVNRTSLFPYNDAISSIKRDCS